MEIINVIHKYMKSGSSWYQRDTAGIKFITVHHTADPQDEVNDEQVLNNIKNEHINNGWPGLSYHFVIIPKSKKIYQTNDFKDVTWHDTVNWDSLGIVVHGYYHPNVNEKPTEDTLKCLRYLLDQLCTKHPEFPADQKSVLGHRERSATACPGDNLIGYVTDYRNKGGKVDWGNYNEPTPQPIDKDKRIKELELQVNTLQTQLNQTNADWQNKLDDYKKKVLQLIEDLKTKL